MLPTLLLSLFTIPLVYIVYSCWCLRQNLIAAKSSGLPYVVLPWNSLNIVWLLTRPFLEPYFRWIPYINDNLTFSLLQVNWPWREQYAIFQRLKCDNFVTVTPAKNYFHTADAAVIDQIVNRRNAFPKPVEIYGSVDLYGQNVVSTEGSVWKHHRKTVSPPFNEKNNRQVWYESIRQAQAMVRGWMGSETDSSATVRTVAKDCMRLSLHVISCAGFGVHLDWPGIENQEKQATANGNLYPKSEKTPEGPKFSPDHTMNYTEALSTLLHSMVWILVLPMYLLKLLPFRGLQTAYNSYIEWGKYLQELFDNKKRDIATGEAQEGMDLMGFLLRGAGVTPESLKQPSTEKTRPKQALSDAEIMGNAFVFLLAGHETAANAIHFSCVYLALHPASRRRLQTSLDRIFGSRPIPEWDYDRDFLSLFGSMAGAVLAEELRLIPPVPAIPKCVPSNSPPQPLLINGKEYYIPSSTYINLIAVAAHRNPKSWPAGPPADPDHPAHPTSNTDNDLEEFKPERWLRGDEKAALLDSASDGGETTASEDAPNTSTGTNVSSNLHRPPRGAYIPFSEGYRACLGRRFAQTEVLAVLAVIFKYYSVELAVDGYASDEEVAGMGAEGKKEVWEKVRGEVWETLREKMGMVFSMQLREGAKVELRFVKRGRERFDF
ncbi:MAG: hypothetical protein Q9219_002074 [cf. Caloplaca sp. 3 TL-2023]